MRLLCRHSDHDRKSFALACLKSVVGMVVSLMSVDAPKELNTRSTGVSGIIKLDGWSQSLESFTPHLISGRHNARHNRARRETMNDKTSVDRAPVDAVVMPFSYANAQTPQGYQCGMCGASCVRLYRKYQTFLDHQKLFCRACALADQQMTAPDGKHTIGWLVAAVPTEEGDTFWGFTSVPDAGVKWWDGLPELVTA